jgi:clan AA aspartic protease (TIGR02281 family)
MIKLGPQDLRSHERPRSSLHTAIAVAIAAVLIFAAVGGGFYYWYVFLPYSNYAEVYHLLGISQMPWGLEHQIKVQSRLDQLSHEPCYRDAVMDLADSMLDAGYPRDVNTILVTFAQRCGESDEMSLIRYKALFAAGDFSTAAQIADTLVQSNPADPYIRYWRGNAYEELKDFPRALTDYINSIQLLGEPLSISISNFYDISRMYAALNRYCDAITPIETYISFDPANRRTAQYSRLIAEYAQKGNCDVQYARGSAIVSRLTLSGAPNANTLVVVVNGVSGNFLLDTGATFVAVTPNFAAKAELEIETGTQLPIKTVGGTASADLGYARTVSVAKAEAQGVPVAVVRGAVDPFGSNLDGLLGMSFLARFKISLSQNAIELTAISLQ